MAEKINTGKLNQLLTLFLPSNASLKPAPVMGFAQTASPSHSCNSNLSHLEASKVPSIR
jgi:hypothetical protein